MGLLNNFNSEKQATTIKYTKTFERQRK